MMRSAYYRVFTGINSLYSKPSTFSRFRKACELFAAGLRIAIANKDKCVYQEGWMEVAAGILADRPHPGAAHPTDTPWFLMTNDEREVVVSSFVPVARAFREFMRTFYGASLNGFVRYANPFPQVIQRYLGEYLRGELKGFDEYFGSVLLKESYVSQDSDIYDPSFFIDLAVMCSEEDGPRHPKMEPGKVVRSPVRQGSDFLSLSESVEILDQLVERGFPAVDFGLYQASIEAYFLSCRDVVAPQACWWTDAMRIHIFTAMTMEAPPWPCLSLHNELARRLHAVEALFEAIWRSVKYYRTVKSKEVGCECPLIRSLLMVEELFDIFGTKLGAFRGFEEYANAILDIIEFVAGMKGMSDCTPSFLFRPPNEKFTECIFCEGDPRGVSVKDFDANVYRGIFGKTHPGTLFYSIGSSSEVVKKTNRVVMLARMRYPHVKIFRLIDRDDCNEVDIARYRADCPDLRVLSKRNIEAYLLNEEILKKFCLSLDRTVEIDGVTAILNEEVQNSIGRGNAPDDIKRVAPNCYARLKRHLRLSLCGAGFETFALLNLVPLITPETRTYKILQKDIFGE